jgi:hypothetical protein
MSRIGYTKVIYIEIVKCSSPYYWYNEKIGLVFPAIKVTDKNHMHYGGYEIACGGAWVHRGDAKPVQIAQIS